MIEIERSDAAGVPVFSCESPGMCRGALLFRTGRADETLPTGGLSHLVEHLALFPIHDREYAIGGMVDDTRTIFFVEGTTEEVSSFMKEVVANLRSLPLERLEDERRILLAEGSSQSTAHDLWRWRFGPKNYGLVSYAELGLEWMTGDMIQDWSDTRMTRQNAALWFRGEIPQDLDLDLPDGERIAPPAVEPMPDLELPAFTNHDQDSFALSFITRRSTAATTGLGILLDRANNHLRRELGLTYSVGGNYWRLTTDDAHVVVGADCSPGHVPAVRDGLLKVLDEMAEHGPTEEELARTRSQIKRQNADPLSIPGWLDSAASNELVGAEQLSVERYMEQLDALDPAEVASDFALGLESMFLALPPSVGVPGSRAVLYGRGWTSPEVEGKGYPIHDAEGNRTGEVVVGDEGVMRKEGQREPITVLYGDCVCVGLHSDYMVTLCNSRGEILEIEFEVEKERSEITDKVLASVPEEIVATLDTGVKERAAVVDALAKEQLGGHNTRAVRYLPRFLLEGETLEELATGKLGGAEMLIAVSDLRSLLLVDKTGVLSAELPHQMVTAADPKKGLLRSSIEFKTDGGAATLGGMSGARAEAVASVINAHREADAGAQAPQPAG